MDNHDKLTLPSIDLLADKVMKLGKGCKVFKIDLQRGYRQFFVDPSDFCWLGYYFDNSYLFDCCLSMGSKSSARCCQMVTSAVVFIHTKAGYFAINYLDDLGGAEKATEAEAGFKHLQEILKRMGLREAPNKTVFPCTVMVFLGIEVNTLTLTLTIPSDKRQEIQLVLKKWAKKEFATKNQTQKLAGLLNFACRCVRSGRVYLSRILNYLRSYNNEKQKPIPEEVRLDIQWWLEFAPRFNGVSLMLESEWSEPDQVLSSDSCLTGGGAVSSTGYLHWRYPGEILRLSLDINELECMMVVIAIKVLGHGLQRKKVLVQCDNQNSVLAIKLW